MLVLADGRGKCTSCNVAIFSSSEGVAAIVASSKDVEGINDGKCLLIDNIHVVRGQGRRISISNIRANDQMCYPEIGLCRSPEMACMRQLLSFQDGPVTP